MILPLMILPPLPFVHFVSSSLALIQAKNVFLRLFASAIGETFVLSNDFKTAFLQHSYRPDVVRCCPGENRPLDNKVEHLCERLSR